MIATSRNRLPSVKVTNNYHNPLRKYAECSNHNWKVGKIWNILMIIKSVTGPNKKDKTVPLQTLE